MLTALPPIYFPTSHHTPPSTTARRAWRFPRDTLVYCILDVLLVSYSHSPTPNRYNIMQLISAVSGLHWVCDVAYLDTFCTVQQPRLCVAAKAYVLSDAAPARGPGDAYQLRLSHVSPAHCLTARRAAARVLAASIADGAGLTPAMLRADLCFEAAGC
jgi:hypothetical protein